MCKKQSVKQLCQEFTQVYFDMILLGGPWEILHEAFRHPATTGINLSIYFIYESAT
jgi:hypothetical protein